jgi:DnaK suppressor protein
MTSDERVQLRRELIERLTEIYRRVRQDLSAAAVERAFAPDPEDEAEEAVVDELRLIGSDLGERDRKLAHQIEDALGRIRDPGFGICVDCSQEIPFERMRAVPWAERCAADQERLERAEERPTL